MIRHHWLFGDISWSSCVILGIFRAPNYPIVGLEVELPNTEGPSDLKAAVSVTGLWKQLELDFTQNKQHFLSFWLASLALSCSFLASYIHICHESICEFTTSLSPDSGMASAGGTPHSDNINDITRCHSVWNSCSDTYLSIQKPVRLHCPPPVSNISCPSHYQGPWAPTVSAHVSRAITRRACIFVLHFLSLLLLRCCFNSWAWRTKLLMFKDKEKAKRLGTDAHFLCFPC